MTKRKKKTTFANRKQEESQKAQAAKQNQETIKYLLIGIGAVVLLCLVIGLLTQIGGGDVEIIDGTGGKLESLYAEVDSSDFTELDLERPLSEVDPSERNAYYEAYPENMIDEDKIYEAVFQTEQGEMRIQLFADKAPLAVNNFVFLATQGFYDGLTFHRVLEGFMAQGGDPTGTGSGGPGYSFADEFANGLSFDRSGLLAMANSGASTNGSQFFITFDREGSSFLTGRHTIFGQLVAGKDVLESLTLRDPDTDPSEPGDLIERIDIYVADR